MTDGPVSAFFNALFADMCALIDRFAITRAPAPMAYISGRLVAEVEQQRSANPFRNPDPSVGSGRRDDVAVGMNTTGMLLDRLTILALKRWNLINRADDAAAASVLEIGQVAEIIEALAQTRPGLSSINNKLTSRQVSTTASDFAEAFYGLATTNLLLWESQEILYNHDIMTLPAEELRAYIDFFSKGNITRNVFIQRSEETFWVAVEGPHQSSVAIS